MLRNTRQPSGGLTSIRCVFGRCGLLLMAALSLQGDVFAQQTQRDGPASESLALQIGIAGNYRVGQWTAVRIDHSQRDSQAALMSVATFDGDNINHQYVDQELTSSPWRYVLPGAPGAPLIVSKASGEELARKRLSDTPVPVDRRWILVFGDTLGTDLLGANELLGRQAQFLTTTIEDAAELPDHWLGFESIDMLLITDRAAPLLQQLSPATIAALITWVQRGGLVVISAGSALAQQWRTSDVLRQLLPDPITAETFTIDPAPLESFTSSQSRLQPLTAWGVPGPAGDALLVGRTTDRQSFVLARRYRYGLGNVIAIGIDLTREPLASWPQLPDLLRGLVPELRPVDPSSTKLGFAGDVNYRDIAGQVMASLDEFENPATLPFSVVGFGLFLLVLLIGPLDYLLVNRWLQWPLMGWISYPLLIGLATGGLLLWYQRGDQQMLTTNRVEVVDIDVVNGKGRGFSWNTIYATNATRLDASTQWNPDGAAILETGDQATFFATAPFGYAGSIFGGIELQVEDQRFAPYAVQVRQRGSDWGSQLEGIPLAAASSKSLATWWNFDTDFSAGRPQRLVRQRFELEGRLVNPLNTDILDGMLLDRDRVYILPSRFRAGAAIERVQELRPRMLRWLLTERRKEDDVIVSTRWNPADTSDLARMLNILAFYQLAGGQSYTGLSNEMLRRLDQSPVVADDRAILIGRLAHDATSLRIARRLPDGQTIPVDVQTGKSTNLIRILLPIQSAPVTP